MENVQRAIAQLEVASADGHAEASERLALIEALGPIRGPDWVRALDFLALAATQGSRRAQDQLLLLADSGSRPVVPTGVYEDFWALVRSRIAIAERMHSPDKQSLSESPRIRVLRNFATAAECEWLISLARPQLAPAPVFDEATGEGSIRSARDNSFFLLRFDEMNVVTEVIRHRIAAATKLPVPLFEHAQILHYAVGQRFEAHHDFLDPANPAYQDSIATFGQRIATFLIYINDGYEGGETSFPNIGLSFRAGLGDALLFANVHSGGTPDLDTLHAGEPPTSGEKWVFSQWIRDRVSGG